MENPKYAYNEARCQYDSKVILKHLMTSWPQDALALMGVTHVDLYVPVLKYVFGVARIEGQCALISTHRLRPEFYGDAPNRDLLMARAEKTALHELGHAFGLTHCRDRRCVMYSSSIIKDTDFKEPAFCPTCKDLFQWYVHKR
jgi:archaemetzincin